MANSWYIAKNDTNSKDTSEVRSARRWGLSAEAIDGLGERLHGFWQRFAACFTTRTRDTSEYAEHYLSGLLRMTTERNFSNLGRTQDVAGQNIQHFISTSP